MKMLPKPHLFFPTLFLAACMGGGTDFQQAQVTRVASGPMDFVVRVKEGRAQAVRHGWVGFKRLGQVYVYGARAMEAASGCKVLDETMRGDPALMTARLDCKNVAVIRVRCTVDDMPGGRGVDLVASCDGPAGREIKVLR